MTVLEMQKFHEHDKKEYDILNNEKFIERFWDSLEGKFDRFLNIEEMQDLINRLTTWYQFKYPENEFDIIDGKTHYFEDLESICKSMNFKQLLIRLPWSQIAFILATYPSFDVCANSEVEGFNKLVDEKVIISYGFYHKIIEDGEECYSEDDYFFVRSTLQGEVFMEDLPSEFKLSENSLTLDELLEIVETVADDDLDYSELKRAVLCHKLELEDRKIVLQLAALSLLYSDSTTPERGYERSKKFIEEFNENIPELNLSTDQIDEIITRKYADERRLLFTPNK